MGSQPWPFPRSLMLGFFARATSSELRPDRDEIVEARWFTRPALLEAVEGGEVLLPGQVSIARRLIETWYGGSLPGDW
jgi:NAD+ diphosphatase